MDGCSILSARPRSIKLENKTCLWTLCYYVTSNQRGSLLAPATKQVRNFPADCFKRSQGRAFLEHDHKRALAAAEEVLKCKRLAMGVFLPLPAHQARGAALHDVSAIAAAERHRQLHIPPDAVLRHRRRLLLPHLPPSAIHVLGRLPLLLLLCLPPRLDHRPPVHRSRPIKLADIPSAKW